MALSLERLPAWLAGQLGARSVRIERQERLGGGAIQENWALDLAVDGGSRHGPLAVVLRTDAASTISVSWSRLQEFAILQVAHKAGVTVPEPICASAEASILGQPFCVMARLGGEARGSRLVRAAWVAERGARLAARLGEELAKTHAVLPPQRGLDFMSMPRGPVAIARVAAYRAILDTLSEVRPVLEHALWRLEQTAPAEVQPVLCHGDFRTGNYLVEDGELQGVLDWEFAAWSDPMEDLGWMTAPCWRFGASQREAGGIGPGEGLIEAYEAASGRIVARDELVYWQGMATARWAVIALQQAHRHLSGKQRSLELALTATLVPGLERDLLDLLEGKQA